jgi:hypothetical protein
MSAAARIALLVVLATTAACQGPAETAEHGAVPPGCGLVDAGAFTGLLGSDLTASLDGSGSRLRHDGEPVACTTSAAGQPGSFVRLTAEHHPDPMQLPHLACNAGWVYAGTPEKYAPACQHAEGRGGRTVLLDRWGEYVVRVTIRRPDRNWAGDPEIALRLSRQLAHRLHLS